MVFIDEFTDRADFSLLRNGAVNLYWKTEIYEKAISSLKDLDYYVLQIRFENIDQFEVELSALLKWQEQFGYAPWGGDLNALNDGFRGEPLSSSDRSVLCISNYQALVEADKDFSFQLLDIIERRSRDYLLFGKALICLVQTHDPTFYCQGIGGTIAHWNGLEWLNSSRGL